MQAGMSRCVVWHWMLEGDHVAALVTIDVRRPDVCYKTDVRTACSATESIV